jgi:hypothetical protein
MRGGDPDTGRGMHRLQQIPRKLAQRGVKHGHGLRRERQPRVGITDDGADGHDPVGIWERNLSDQSGMIVLRIVVPLCLFRIMP